MENVTEIKRIRQTIKTLLKEEYAFVKDTIDLIEIKTDGDMKNAGDFRIKVNKFCKMLEDKRKTEVDPFNKLVKDINAEFKQATSLFDNELSRLDDKIKPFLIEVARKKEEAARAARESELAEMARKKEEESDISEKKFEVPLSKMVLKGFMFFCFLIIFILLQTKNLRTVAKSFFRAISNILP